MDLTINGHYTFKGRKCKLLYAERECSIKENSFSYDQLWKPIFNCQVMFEDGEISWVTSCYLKEVLGGYQPKPKIMEDVKKVEMRDE